MNESTALERALLSLGLEDLIALPEIPGAEEVRSLREAVAVEELEDALIGLLREGLIQVWSGHWSQSPEVVGRATGEELLRDKGQYEFNSPADVRLRVYYVNVDNLYVPE